MSKTKEKFWMDQDDNKIFSAAIHTLVRQFHSAVTLESIRRSFVLAVFSYNTRTASSVLKFLKERMMKNAGFRQVSEGDVPLDSLSIRRQHAQFEFVNMESFQLFDESKSIFNRGIVRKSCISFFMYFHFFALSEVTSESPF
jgi:hypothetical protein